MEDFEEWKKRKGIAPDEYDYGSSADERDWYTKHRSNLQEREDTNEEEWILGSSVEKDLDELYRIQREKDKQARNGSESEPSSDIEEEAAREIKEKVHKKGTKTINLTLNKEIGLEPHKFGEHDEEIFAKFARKEGGLAAMKQMEEEEKESREYYKNPFDYKAKHTKENKSKNLSEDIANTLSSVYKDDDEAKKEQESAERAAELASMSPKEREFAKKYPKLAKMKGGYEYLANRYANKSYQRQTIDLINAGCKEEDVCNYMDLKQYRDAAIREGLPQPTIDKISEKIAAYERRLEAQKHDAKKKKKEDAVELSKLDKILNPNKPSRGGIGIRATAPREWQPRTNTSLRGRGNPTNVRLGGTSVAGMPTLSTPRINLDNITHRAQPSPKQSLEAYRSYRADKEAQAAYQRQIENERQKQRDARYQQTFMQKGSNVTKNFIVSPARIGMQQFKTSAGKGVQVSARFKVPDLKSPSAQIAVVRPRIGTSVGTSSRKTHNEFLAISKPRNVVSTSGKINQNKSASPAAHISRNIAGMIAPTRAHTSGHTRVSTGIASIVNNSTATGHAHHVGRKFNMDVRLPDIQLPGLKKKKKIVKK